MPFDTSDLHLVALRWAHILAAIVAVGGLFFARFGLLPGLKGIDADTQAKIHESIRKSWLPWVIIAITLLLATGLVNFLLFNNRVKEEEWAGGQWMKRENYHLLFGVKFLLSMVVFYFASALVGRGRGTQWLRDNRARWLSFTLLLAIAVVLLSGWMRTRHTGENLGGQEGVSIRQRTEEKPDDRYKDESAGSVFREPAPAP